MNPSTMKVSMIGLGHVGATLAYTIVMKGLANELVLINRNIDKARSDAQDLIHSLAFTPHRMDIYAGGMGDAKGSDVVILCVSVPWQPSYNSRFDLAPGNVKLFKELLPSLVSSCPDATFIIITNPVDVMTYCMLKITGLPAHRVMGVGTLIDSARFREYLSQEKGVHPDDIRAYVLGEHGDSQFPALSIAYAGGEHIANKIDSEEVFRQAAFSGQEIMKGKGYSNFAVSMATALIVESIFMDSLRTIPVSTLIDGYLGESDVCLSVPAIIGSKGIVRVLKPELNDEEQQAFHVCAGLIREQIDQLKIA